MVLYFRGRGGQFGIGLIVWLVWSRATRPRCALGSAHIAGESPAAPSTLVACRLCLGQCLAAWVRRHDQPAGALHGGAVIGIDRAAKEARLVGGAVDASVRPGELVPAAHFDKALQEGICHGCFWVPSM